MVVAAGDLVAVTALSVSLVLLAQFCLNGMLTIGGWGECPNGLFEVSTPGGEGWSQATSRVTSNSSPTHINFSDVLCVGVALHVVVASQDNPNSVGQRPATSSVQPHSNEDHRFGSTKPA